jgi:hypothetical protein
MPLEPIHAAWDGNTVSPGPSAAFGATPTCPLVVISACAEAQDKAAAKAVACIRYEWFDISAPRRARHAAPVTMSEPRAQVIPKSIHHAKLGGLN